MVDDVFVAVGGASAPPNSSLPTILIFKKLRTQRTKARFSAIGPRKLLAKLFVLRGEASPIAEKVTSRPSVS